LGSGAPVGPFRDGGWVFTGPDENQSHVMKTLIIYVVLYLMDDQTYQIIGAAFELVELKALAKLGDAETAQVFNYLLINFGKRSLKHQR
jgi:hypothetical protein